MKITKSQLKEIIEEEINYLIEGQLDEAWYHKLLGKEPPKTPEEIKAEKEKRHADFKKKYPPVDFKRTPRVPPSKEEQERLNANYRRRKITMEVNSLISHANQELEEVGDIANFEDMLVPDNALKSASNISNIIKELKLLNEKAWKIQEKYISPNAPTSTNLRFIHEDIPEYEEALNSRKKIYNFIIATVKEIKKLTKSEPGEA
jgi:hypothetical protein